MADTLTDEYHDWVSDALGADPRAYPSSSDKPQPAADDAQDSTVSSADVSAPSGPGSQTDAGVPSDTAQPPPAARPGGGTSDASGSNGSDAGQDDSSSNPNVLAMAGGKKDNRPPPAHDLDEGEGKNSDGSVKRKPGEGRGSDGDIIAEAVRDFGLTPDEARKLHDQISGRGYGRDKIRQIAQDIVKDRRATKKPNQDEDANKDNDKPLESDDSMLAKIGALIAMLGLSIVLIPSIAAAILDPEPATKLAAIGLTVIEIAAFAKAFNFVFSAPSSGEPSA